MRDAAAGATAAREKTAGANGGALMRSIIQRIATGPELSKDITRDEAALWHAPWCSTARSIRCAPRSSSSPCA